MGEARALERLHGGRRTPAGLAIGHDAPLAVGFEFGEPCSQVVDWESKDPLTLRFVADFKARYNRNPDTTAANYYNAVRLFGVLARELQKQGKPINAENLLAQRLALKNFDFIGGKVGFDDTGTVMMPIQVNEITGPGGGKMVSLRK